MTNHTPGPWNVHGDDKTLIGASDGKMMLAQTMYLHVVPKWKRNLAEAQANAHLIAAAPDMLAALQEALNGYGIECNCGSECLGTCTNAHVLAAINKAKGEQP